MFERVAVLISKMLVTETKMGSQKSDQHFENLNKKIDQLKVNAKHDHATSSEVSNYAASKTFLWFCAF
jgi:hypothetical protein